MKIGRGEFSFVVLQNDEGEESGRVLAVGGIATDATAIASAEIYDPVTGTWSLTGSMSTGRNDVALVVLKDGKVLAAGGGMGDEHLPRHASAEIFDLHTGQWTLIGDMTMPRSEMEHAAVLLRNGRVLVPGGYVAHETPTSTTDVYNPQSGTWTAGGSMNNARTGQVVLVLRGHRGALVMGGLNQSPATTASVDIGRPGDEEKSRRPRVVRLMHKAQTGHRGFFCFPWLLHSIKKRSGFIGYSCRSPSRNAPREPI